MFDFTLHRPLQAAGESINQYTQKALLARMGLTEWPQLKELEEDQ